MWSVEQTGIGVNDDLRAYCYGRRGGDYTQARRKYGSMANASASSCIVCRFVLYESGNE